MTHKVDGPSAAKERVTEREAPLSAVQSRARLAAGRALVAAAAGEAVTLIEGADLLLGIRGRVRLDPPDGEFPATQPRSPTPPDDGGAAGAAAGPPLRRMGAQIGEFDKNGCSQW